MRAAGNRNGSSSSAVTTGMRRNGGISSRKLVAVWLLLLLVTWVPPVVLAVNKARLADQDTGTVLVFFPVGSTRAENFERIVAAQGGFVRQTWLEQLWVAASYQPGFVGRLKEKGAWAVFHPVLLDPALLMGCGPLWTGQPI